MYDILVIRDPIKLLLLILFAVLLFLFFRWIDSDHELCDNGDPSLCRPYAKKHDCDYCRAALELDKKRELTSLKVLDKPKDPDRREGTGFS